MVLALLSAGFQTLSSTFHNQIGPFWCWFPGGWFVYVLGPCGSLQRTLLCSWEFLPLPPWPPQEFSVRSFEALFPCTRTLGCEVCLIPQLLLPVYLPETVGLNPQSTAWLGPQSAAWLVLPAATLPAIYSLAHPVPPATALPQVLFAPPTGLDECFFFNSLVVGLPYSSIFWQLWLSLVFKLLSFFWLCEEAQCVHLHLHLGRKSETLFIIAKDWKQPKCPSVGDRYIMTHPHDVI